MTRTTPTPEDPLTPPDDEKQSTARRMLAALTTRSPNPTPIGPRTTTFPTARAERRAAGHRGERKYRTARHASHAAGAIKEAPLTAAERRAAQKLARKAARKAARGLTLDGAPSDGRSVPPAEGAQ